MNTDMDIDINVVTGTDLSLIHICEIPHPADLLCL